VQNAILRHMLNYNQITPKKFIIHQGEPWEVIESAVSRKQANKPVNKTKIKNLTSGRVVDQTFHVSDKVREAEMSKDFIKYLYTDYRKGQIWFCEFDNPKNRFSLKPEIVGESIKYIPENTKLTGLVFTDKEGEENILNVLYPMKITLEITEAPPNIKGDSATGGNKVCKVETGANISCPLFINVGDKVSISVETGQVFLYKTSSSALIN